MKRFLSYSRAYRLSSCRSTNAMKSPNTMPMHPQRPFTPLRPLRIALAVVCIGWLVHAGTAHAQDHSVIDYRYDMFCPGNFHHQSNYHYDPAAALKMADYAIHAYEIKSSDDDATSASLLKNAMGSDYKDVVILNNRGAINVQAFAKETPTKIIVAFKGTDPEDNGGVDVMSDLDSAGTNFLVNGVSVGAGQVHRGFFNQAKAFEEMAKTARLPSGQFLHAALLNSGKDVYLAGHSLGGAVAALYGAMLREYGVAKNRMSVYTFGAPSVGDKKFADRYEVFRDTGINMFRIRNRSDAVPYLAYLQVDTAVVRDCVTSGAVAAGAAAALGPAGAAAAGATTAGRCVLKAVGSSFISHRYHHIGFLRVHTPGSWAEGGGRQVHVDDNSGLLAPIGDVLTGTTIVLLNSPNALDEHSMERYRSHVQRNDTFNVPVDIAPPCYIASNGNQELVAPDESYGSKFNLDRFANSSDYHAYRPAITAPHIVNGVLELGLRFDAPHFYSNASDLAPEFHQINGSAQRPMAVYSIGTQGAMNLLGTVQDAGQTIVLKEGMAPAFLFDRQGLHTMRLLVEMKNLPFITTVEPERKLSKELTISLAAADVTFDRQYTRRQLVFENPLDAAWDASQRTATLKAGEKIKICVGAQDSMPGYAFQNHVLWIEPEMGGSPISLQGTNYDVASGCSEFTAPSVAGRYRFNQLQARVNGPYGEEFMGLGLIKGDYYQVSGFDQPANPGGGTPGTGTAGTHPLNDTGITWSGNYPSGNEVDCKTSPAGQDCHYGRDAQAAAGQLTKKGGGNAGFDFTKISNSGAELPESATLGSDFDDWACTRDNVTGLIWEVKTTTGLRSQNHTYTWFNSSNTWFNTSNPDEGSGIASGGTCETTGRCDTEKYVADVNTGMGLCGAADWRMPTVRELQSIVNLNNLYYDEEIDPAYFPSPPSLVWSDLPHLAYISAAWSVNLRNGGIGADNPARDLYVLLVRGGK